MVKMDKAYQIPLEVISRIAPRIDDSRTRNDFGFHKRSFEMRFVEDEIIRLPAENLERQMLESTAIQKDGGLWDVIKAIKEVRQMSIKRQDPHDASVASEIQRQDILSQPDGVYETHTALYNKVMQSYLYDEKVQKSAGVDLQQSYASSDNKRGFSQGDEVISYKERIEYVKAVMMNSLMHAPVNAVDPGMKERFEYWKLASKFNQIMAFLYYDTIMA